MDTFKGDLSSFLFTDPIMLSSVYFSVIQKVVLKLKFKSKYA